MTSGTERPQRGNRSRKVTKSKKLSRSVYFQAIHEGFNCSQGAWGAVIEDPSIGDTIHRSGMCVATSAQHAALLGLANLVSELAGIREDDLSVFAPEYLVKGMNERLEVWKATGFERSIGHYLSLQSEEIPDPSYSVDEFDNSVTYETKIKHEPDWRALDEVCRSYPGKIEFKTAPGRGAGSRRIKDRLRDAHNLAREALGKPPKAKPSPIGKAVCPNPDCGRAINVFVFGGRCFRCGRQWSRDQLEILEQ